MTDKEKQDFGEKIIARMTKYLEQICDDPKSSDTKIRHMQLGIYGCKMIVRDECKLKQETEWSAV